MSQVFERAVVLFGELCDLPPREQAERLAALEAEDPELAATVAEILSGDQRPDERIDRRAKDFVALESVALEPQEVTVSAEVIERLVERGRSSSHYRTEGRIAEGGMGAIYSIFDQDIERRLVLKTLGKADEPHESLGRRRFKRFLDEARVTGQLDHPGVVPVHDLGIDAKGRAYFTMKYVKGRTLQEVFDLIQRREEGWSTTRALGVLLRVCEAMSYAHSKGVVHRDLKPSNVMVGRFGEVYVMDWGVAWVRSGPDDKDLRPRSTVLEPTGEVRLDSPVVTMDGTVVGTPYYMSPEQARGGWIDERSDVYAIGAMLYALLTGQPPHRDPETDNHPYEILKRVIEGPPVLIRSLTRSPAELEAICLKAMARAAEDRYRSVQELGDDLRAYLEGRVVRAHETGAVAELRKWFSRNRAFASALGAALVILVTGSVVAWGLRQEAQASDTEARAERTHKLRLMNVLRLEHLLKEGDELWPAHPEHIQAYTSWLYCSKTIPEDHKARLLEVQSHANPLSEEERERDRQAHPRFSELCAVENRLVVERRADAIRRGLLEPEEFVLEESSLRRDPVLLNEMAWPLVRPDRAVFGRESEGLALATFADLQVNNQLQRADVSDTLAWGYFANGMDEEARAEMDAALEAAGPSRQEQFTQQAERLFSAIEEAASGETLARLENEHAVLEQEVSQRRTWTYASEEDQLWNDILVETESMLGTVDELIDGTSSEHGWGVKRRLEWAQGVEELTVTGEQAARLWRAAIASIEDQETCPAYAGLVIEPQMGLLPLGRDAISGLWEFALPQSGEVPRRGADGQLQLGPESALVFVLVPGGAFAMGAQATWPSAPNYDSLARPSEGPVHQIELSPFFISKYEMTQGQWLRMTGENPSFYSPEYELVQGTTLLHPVESVSWHDSARICMWLGLRLPTEAEWEYAARASTQTPWWTGPSRETLLGNINLADQAAGRGRASWTEIADWGDLDDGFIVHGPVDSFRPNPFGLHQVHGNVFEWCQDLFEPDFYADSAAVNPVNDVQGSGARVSRGGSFRSTSANARISYRQSDDPGTAQSSIGLRPARSLSAAR